MTAFVEKLRSLNGSQYGLIAAGTGTTTLYSAGPGCVGNVIVTATGTATRSVYDGTSIVFTVPASAAQGTVYQVNCPFGNGGLITDGAAGAPGLTVVFNGWAKYAGGA